jgi:hypothetical protein
VRLDDADDNVRTATRAPVPFLEHRVGLADARCRTEVDA